MKRLQNIGKLHNFFMVLIDTEKKTITIKLDNRAVTANMGDKNDSVETELAVKSIGRKVMFEIYKALGIECTPGDKRLSS